MSAKGIIYLCLALVILISIFIEYVISQKKKDSLYDLNDLKNNFLIGSGQMAIALNVALITAAAYSFTYDNFRITTFEKGPLSFIILLLGIDFTLYWVHVLTHRVNILWAMHLVHHSSNSYNLGLTLRNPWLFSLIYMLPYCLFALLGFPKEFFFMVMGVNGLTQTFQHGRYLGNWGILEKVLVTPDFHRAHHGSEEKYWDCNFGRMLSIWDYLFKSYLPPEENMPYGLGMPTHINDPLQENTYYLKKIAFLFKRSSGVKEKTLSIFGSPSYLPSSVNSEEMKDFMNEITMSENTITVKRGLFSSLSIVLLTVTYALYFDNLDLTERLLGLSSILLIMCPFGSSIREGGTIIPVFKYLRRS